MANEVLTDHSGWTVSTGGSKAMGGGGGGGFTDSVSPFPSMPGMSSNNMMLLAGLALVIVIAIKKAAKK